MNLETSIKWVPGRRRRGPPRENSPSLPLPLAHGQQGGHCPCPPSALCPAAHRRRSSAAGKGQGVWAGHPPLPLEGTLLQGAGFAGEQSKTDANGRKNPSEMGDCS